MTIRRTAAEAATTLARRSIRQCLADLASGRDPENETRDELAWFGAVIDRLQKIHDALLNGTPTEPPHELRIDGTWLVEDVGEHTCGAGDHGQHEPGCGSIPVVDLATLDGWEEAAALRSAPLANETPPEIDALPDDRCRRHPDCGRPHGH